MAVAYVTGSVKASTTATAVVTQPASIVATNLLVAVLTCPTASSTFTPPSGWSLAFAIGTSTDGTLAVYTKVATGSEPSTYTFTGSHVNTSAAVLQFSGATNASPVDVSAYKVTATTTYAWTRPTTKNNTELLVLAAVSHTTGTTWATVTGATKREVAKSTGASIGTWTAPQATAGETAAFTATGNQHGTTLIFAIKSAGANVVQLTAVVATSNTATSYTRTLSGVVAGHPLVLAHTGVATANTISSISGGGATWTKIKQKSNTNPATHINSELWVGKGGTGGSITVTVTMSAKDDCQGQLYELSGTTGTLTGSAVTFTSGTTKVATVTAVPSITPGQTGTLAIYNCVTETHPAKTGPSGWVTTKTPTFSGTAYSMVSYLTEQTATAYAPTWKFTATGYICAVGCVFKPSGGTPIVLAGSSTSTSSAVGTLTVSAGESLTGHSTSVSSAAGTLTVKVGLAGSASSASSATGTLTVRSGTAPTYTLRATFPTKKTTTTSTQTITTVAIGDLVAVIVHVEPSTGTSHVTSMSDTNSRISWHSSAATVLTQATGSNNRIELWYGTVTSVGATKIETHWSGTTFDKFIYVWEVESSHGASSVWSVVHAGPRSSIVASGHTGHYPTLESGTTGGVYVGWVYPAPTVDGSAGSTSGFTYTLDSYTNVLVWGLSLAATTHYAPTFQQTPATRFYVGIAGIFAATSSGTPVALAGSLASTSSASGALTVHVALAGSSTSASSATGTLTAGAALAGSCTATSTAIGALSTPIALAGSSSSTSSATGILTAHVALSGSTTSVSSATGTLTVPVGEALAGSSVSASSLSGSLSAKASLGGASSSTSSLSGSLSVAGALSGSTSSVSSLAGTLGVKTALAGSTASASSLTGTLTVSAGESLTGHSTSVSSAAGTLGVKIALSGSSASASAASATLTAHIALAASSSSASSATGTLATGPLALSGHCTSTSTSVGALSVPLGLAGSSTSTSSASGTLTIRGAIALAGASVSVSTLSATITATVPVAGFADVLIGFATAEVSVTFAVADVTLAFATADVEILIGG